MEKHEIIALLQSQQINPTKQRIEIAQLMFERDQHLCAEQVMHALEAGGRTKASKATVYNTLNLFSQNGLLRELCVDSGKVYYDSNTSDHHHIYNVDTGELWDVETGEKPALQTAYLPDGTRFIGLEVVYRVKSGC